MSRYARFVLMATMLRGLLLAGGCSGLDAEVGWSGGYRHYPYTPTAIAIRTACGSSMIRGSHSIGVTGPNHPWLRRSLLHRSSPTRLLSIAHSGDNLYGPAGIDG